jgi:hypothetical protein
MGLHSFALSFLKEALFTYLANLGRNLMSNKLFSNLAVVAVSATVASLALQAAPAQAATFNFSFTLGSNLLPQAAGQTGTGSFTFDETQVLPTAPFQTIIPSAYTLNFLGKTFNVADTTAGVLVNYFSGQFSGVGYRLPTAGLAGTGLRNFTQNDTTFSAVDTSRNQSNGTVRYTPVTGEVIPTPALLPGLVGLGFAAVRKRQAKAA